MKRERGRGQIVSIRHVFTFVVILSIRSFIFSIILIFLLAIFVNTSISRLLMNESWRRPTTFFKQELTCYSWKKLTKSIIEQELMLMLAQDE